MKTQAPTAFRLRWHGHEEGPVPWSEIERRLASHEAGLLHEIEHQGRWMTVRAFLALRHHEEQAERARDEAAARAAREKAESEARAREAQQREELLAEERRKNDLLQMAIQTQQGAPPHLSRPPVRSWLPALGWLLLVAGASMAFYFFVIFDSSVSTDSGNRVFNLGLMQDRQAGLLLGLGMAAAGVLLAVFGGKTAHD